MKLIGRIGSLALLNTCLLSGAAWGHGYVENSRNHLCSTGANTNCGAVQFEPQSVEGPDRFPQTGPADGTLAAAGSGTWAPLNAAGPGRWQQNSISAGPNTFHWHFTANHVSRDFRYFITREGWDPNQPLSRAQLDLTPFCEFDSGLTRPDVDTFHNCNVPQRQGFHVILAVWDVGDTAASFYNAIDVVFGDAGDFEPPVVDPDDGDDQGDAGEPQDPDTAVIVGNIHPSMALQAGDEVQLRIFTEQGERAGDEIRFAIVSDAAGEQQRWPQDFANHINQTSHELQAGRVDGDGNVVPVRGHNDVFAAPSTDIVRTEVLVVKADTTAADQPVYPAGVGSYAQDDLVIGSNGNRYRCLIAGWCNGSRTYYEPGVGLAWQDAWTLVATGVAPPTSEPAAHDYPAGRGSYTAGMVVRGTDGVAYTCRVPGWCNSSSEFYYAPGTGLAWQDAWAE